MFSVLHIPHVSPPQMFFIQLCTTQGELFPIDPWGNPICVAPVTFFREEDVLSSTSPSPAHTIQTTLYSSETQHMDIQC